MGKPRYTKHEVKAAVGSMIVVDYADSVSVQGILLPIKYEGYSVLILDKRGRFDIVYFDNHCQVAQIDKEIKTVLVDYLTSELAK